MRIRHLGLRMTGDGKAKNLKVLNAAIAFMVHGTKLWRWWINYSSSSTYQVYFRFKKQETKSAFSKKALWLLGIICDSHFVAAHIKILSVVSELRHIWHKQVKEKIPLRPTSNTIRLISSLNQKQISHSTITQHPETNFHLD